MTEKLPPGSYTLDEWCVRRRISRAMFYKLDEQGLAPRSHKVGTKRLISCEADAAWVTQMEAETNNGANQAADREGSSY